MRSRASEFAGMTAALGCAMFAGCATNFGLPEERNDDGFQRVETSLLDELYVSPGVPLANYKRVMLDPIEVTFEDGWRKRHQELSDKQVEAVRTRLAATLREILVKELADGGYVLAEAPDRDVLRVRAGIENADLAAPDAGADLDVRTFVRSVGKMTLRIQAFDAPSGALVARARDYEEDPESQRFERADRVTTQVAARRIFEKWAEALRSALDVAKVSAGARAPQN